jgi:hypothetical protein
VAWAGGMAEMIGVHDHNPHTGPVLKHGRSGKKINSQSEENFCPKKIKFDVDQK